MCCVEQAESAAGERQKQLMQLNELPLSCLFRGAIHLQCLHPSGTTETHVITSASGEAGEGGLWLGPSLPQIRVVFSCLGR